jgi:predicted transcriptional regulator
MNSSERISIEQYNKEIDASIADIEAGNHHTQEEVKEMVKQWGRK